MNAQANIQARSKMSKYSYCFNLQFLRGKKQSSNEKCLLFDEAATWTGRSMKRFTTVTPLAGLDSAQRLTVKECQAEAGGR